MYDEPFPQERIDAVRKTPGIDDDPRNIPGWPDVAEMIHLEAIDIARMYEIPVELLTSQPYHPHGSSDR